MKISHLLSLVILLTFSNYCDAEVILVNQLFIEKDVENHEVPEGFCKIKGIIYEGYSGERVSFATIANYNSTKACTSNENGVFEFLVSENDSIIYAHHQEYGEIIGKPYDFKSQHEVTVSFVTGVKSTDLMPVVEKPVIYLYSDESVNAKLTLAFEGELIFSYPEYKGKWKVDVGDSGLMVDEKEYPYLFWEGELALDFVTNKQGVVYGDYISTDTTVSYLENKLTKFGFNATEKLTL